MREWMREPEDDRPVVAECCMCGRPIHGSNHSHYGDSYFVIDFDAICDECVTDYLNQYCRKGD
jgi:hypothetical protein